jgi:hypothetical protein
MYLSHPQALVDTPKQKTQFSNAFTLMLSTVVWLEELCFSVHGAGQRQEPPQLKERATESL